VPASTKLQEVFGDDLQVIFVECQGATPAQAEGFSLARRWLGGRAMWTSEPPFPTGATGLPNFVLLGNDGKVLLKGNPLAQPKEIERQIAEQIKARKSAPPDAPAIVSPAWSDFNRGKIAKAFDVLAEIEKENAGKSDVLDLVRATDREFRTRIDARLNRESALIDSGYFEEAAGQLEELRKSSQGEAMISQRCRALIEKLESPELKSEREAAKALGRLLPEFFKKGGDAAATAELTRFVDTHRGTKAAARAEHLLGLPRG